MLVRRPGSSTTPSRTSRRSARPSTSASSAPRAGYDINQHLIPYTNDSTHGRAAIVGILNTFLVAILGCITRHDHRRPHRRAAAVAELAGRPAGRRLRRHLPQHPGAALDPRLHGGPDRHRAGAHGLPRRERHRPHDLRRRRDHQPRRLHALAGLRARLAARRRRLPRLARVAAACAFGRYARAAAGGDRRDRCRPSGSSSRIFILPTLLVDLLLGGADQLSTSRRSSASTSRAAASSTSR